MYTVLSYKNTPIVPTLTIQRKNCSAHFYNDKIASVAI